MAPRRPATGQMQKVSAIFLALLVAACASAGVKVTEQQAQSFQVGHSTYAEVVAGLGEPTTTTTNSNGTCVAVYNYASVQSRPQNFIPYIGPLVAGYDKSTSAVSFTFDAKGLLQGTSSSQSNMGIGTGLAAGGVQPTTTQPR
jgi:hypothetical protein